MRDDGRFSPGEIDEDEQALRQRMGQDLRDVLRRVEAPDGLAAGVLARLADEDGQPARLAKNAGRSWWQGSTRVVAEGKVPAKAWGSTGAIAAALLLMLLPAAGYVHERRQEKEAEAAAQQFSRAMRLTQEALLAAGDHVVSRGSEHTHPSRR